MSDPAVNISPESVAAESAAHGAQQFRSHVGHISRQSGVFFAGTLFTAAFGYLFKVYLARVLGPEDLGLYALGGTLIGFVGIFNALGLPQSAMRFVAEYQASGRFRELHALLWRGAMVLMVANIVLAIFLLTAGRGIATYFYHAPRLVNYLPFFAAIMVAGVVSGFYGKVLAGYRDLKLRTLIVNFVGVPLTMVAAVLLISMGMGLRGYLLAQIVSAGVVCILLVAAVRQMTPSEARFSSMPGSFPERKVWSFSVAMLGVGFMEFAMTQVDRIALGYFRGARDVGIYSIAAAVVVYVPLALSSVNQIFAPTIADLLTRGDRGLLSRLFQSLTKWVIGLTIPLAVVVMVFARPVMRIFGPAFEAAWPILVIGTAGQLVNCGVGSVGYLLLMSGNEKRLLKVQISMAAMMVILSAILVPIWGLVGAALAAAITNVGVNVGNLFEVRRTLGLSPYNRGYLRLLLPTFVVIGVSAVLKSSLSAMRHDWEILIIALGTAYILFSTIILLSGLEADDRLIARAIWSRVRAPFSRVGSEGI